MENGIGERQAHTSFPPVRAARLSCALAMDTCSRTIGLLPRLRNLSRRGGTALGYHPLLTYRFWLYRRVNHSTPPESYQRASGISSASTLPPSPSPLSAAPPLAAPLAAPTPRWPEPGRSAGGVGPEQGWSEVGARFPGRNAGARFTTRFACGEPKVGARPERGHPGGVIAIGITFPKFSGAFRKVSTKPGSSSVNSLGVHKSPYLLEQPREAGPSRVLRQC